MRNKNKKHLKNSLLSLCLLIAMLASVFPVSAVATTLTGSEENTLQEAEQRIESNTSSSLGTQRTRTDESEPLVASATVSNSGTNITAPGVDGNTFSLVVGETRQFYHPADGVTADVSWHSEYTNIATVHGATGMVTAQSIGRSMIYVFVYGYDGSYDSYWFYVDVVSESTNLDAGVYALSSLPKTTSFVKCATVMGGTYLLQQTLSSTPLSEANRGYMFKIAYRPSTYDYVIRSMYNNEAVIYANPSYNAPLSLRMSKVEDHLIPTEKAWKIMLSSDGDHYYIYTVVNGGIYYMCMPSSGNMTLTTNKDEQGTLFFLHEYNGVSFKGWGKIGTWSDHIEHGSNTTFEAYLYSTVIGENHAWTESNSDEDNIVDVSYPTGTWSQVRLTPKYGGNAVIEISSNSNLTVFGEYHLTAGWDSGCFFIQNRYSSNIYLTPTGVSSEADLMITSMPNGTMLAYTLWKFTYCGNGYYHIVQDIKQEAVYENTSEPYNIKTKYNASTSDSNSLWKFIAQSDGTFKIQSKNNSGTNKYMALDDLLENNISSLANTGNKQKWQIRPLSFNVDIYYDQAFIEEYGSNNYMSTFDEIWGVNSAGKSIESNMLNNLGFHLKINYVSTSSNTYSTLPYNSGCSLLHSDTVCKNPNPTSPYNCTYFSVVNILENCQNGYHHKNGNRIWSEIPDVETHLSTSCRIVFTGFECCNIYEGNHYVGELNVLGLSSNKTKCLIMSNDDNETRSTTQHELTHLLGAPDCNFSDNEYCIMGNNKFDPSIVDNMILCDSCVDDILYLKCLFYQH